MFDLNSEVRNWCRSVHVAGLRREYLVTELEGRWGRFVHHDPLPRRFFGFASRSSRRV